MSQFRRISFVCVAEGSESSSDSEGDAEEKAENERYDMRRCFSLELLRRLLWVWVGFRGPFISCRIDNCCCSVTCCGVLHSLA
jgi:hypothetical protein